MAPSAKSLILDLLSTLPRSYPVPVAALVRAGGTLSVGENSIRVALARLRSRGMVESNERGLYRLAAASEPVNRHVRSWRTLEQSVGHWDGSWVAVDVRTGTRSSARLRERALRLLGFRMLERSLYLRPNNLSGGAEGSRARLNSLAPEMGSLVFRLSELDSVTNRRATRLWDSAALESNYAATRARLQASAARLPELSDAEAMAESFLVGGDAVRQIVLDPLLPDPIIDTSSRRALTDAMREYDRLGRRCWKAWAGDAGELEQSPGDGWRPDAALELA